MAHAAPETAADGYTPAEDVGIILLEAPDACEAVQGAAELVSVQHAELGHAHWQLPVASPRVVEDQAVPCRRMRAASPHRMMAAAHVMDVNGHVAGNAIA